MKKLKLGTTAIPHPPLPTPHSLFLVIAIISVLSSCYFTTIPSHPSPDAFHEAAFRSWNEVESRYEPQESPFIVWNQQITGMASDGINVVAVSYEGTIAFSDDYGVNWEIAEPMLGAFPDGINFNAVTWGEGYFLAGGDFGKAAWSKDGKVWYAGVIGPMSPKNILTLSAGRLKGQRVFIAAGTDGRIAYSVNSPEGPWFQVSFSPFGNKENEGEAVNALAYGMVKGAGIFVAAGNNGNIAVMNDFSGYLSGPSAAATRENFNAAAFGNERFITVGDGASVRISSDPENYIWTVSRDSGFGLRPFLNIAYFTPLDFFVLIADESVVGFSESGETWSAATFESIFAEGISAIACTKKRIVLGGADGIIVYSN